MNEMNSARAICGPRSIASLWTESPPISGQRRKCGTSRAHFGTDEYRRRLHLDGFGGVRPRYIGPPLPDYPEGTDQHSHEWYGIWDMRLKWMNFETGRYLEQADHPLGAATTIRISIAIAGRAPIGSTTRRSAPKPSANTPSGRSCAATWRHSTCTICCAVWKPR